jgi:capsular exopolysaccharide synthesis family protein
MALRKYFKIAKRRWLPITLLVVAALAIVYWTSPPTATDPYDATNILLVEAADGQGNAADANLHVVALRATVGEVPIRAAAKLGYEGDPATLARQVTATPDLARGTVAIVASDPDPARAALIANTFSAEVVAYLQGQEAAEIAAEATEDEARFTELRARVDELDTAIADEPDNVETLTAERDALNRQLSRLLEAQEEQAEPVQYSVLQPATTAVQQDRLPGTGSRGQRMLFAGLVALVLGFGLAVVLDRSDTRVRTRREAEARFGLPVIAEIPTLSLPKRRRKVVVAEDPDSVKAEAYRTLRAAIMLHRRKDDDIGFTRPRHERVAAQEGMSRNGRRGRPERDVILVTSPGAGDGKTTTVANLAVAYAESGRSVLVLSADLWRSGAARRFGVNPSRGVSDFLASDGATPLSSYVRKTSVPGVQVVTGGLAIRRPGGRLVAEQRMIDEAHRLADVVIIDTAPLPTASLTWELTTMVDAVLVVCRVERTTTADAERCADLLEQLGAPALGVVMVGVTTPLFSDYFFYAAPRRTRRRAEEAAADAGEARTAQTDGHGQPTVERTGRYPPPSSRPVEAGPFDSPGATGEVRRNLGSAEQV